MPRRGDIHSIMVIGSGPIVIGQACEFDYSGTQACQVLRADGYRVILVNSNPATIMTDPATADVTYVEPLDPDVLTDILEKERPDALLPTLGGQTALNLTMELVGRGVTQRLGIEVIGARPEAIETAENRELFKAAMGSAFPSRVSPIRSTRPCASATRSAIRSSSVPASFWAGRARESPTTTAT